MIDFVIGPSGVGKSSLCKAAGLEGIRIYVDLDLEMKSKDRDTCCGLPENSEFGNLAKSCILEIENNDSASEVWLVDVGAGCMANQELLEWFKSKEYLLAVIDIPEKVFERARMRPNGYWKSRSLGEYINSEFSNKKKTLYDSAIYKFDVQGNDLEMARERFVRYIKEITNL